MPQYVPEVQEFLKWLERNYVSCKIIAKDGNVREDEKFVPQKHVQGKFTEHDFALARALRDAVLPKSERHSVTAQAIADDCAIVSCILLNLKQGQLIPYFYRNGDLHDNRLPFHTKPSAFPVVHPGFFDEFRIEQRKFFPNLMQNLDDTTINDEYILPFVKRETIARGGSARIDKVSIHEEYDRLFRRTQEGPIRSKDHCYAIKTYEGDGAKEYYQREVEAFNRLRENDKSYPCPNLVGYHGSYVHRGTYNVILEFANGGTLEDYFRDQREPRNGQDIIDFWESFFGVVRAIYRLHEQMLDEDDPNCRSILHGWHQDIKPQNILVFRTGTNPYKWTFKLADLGLSHFKAESAAQNNVVDLDSFGTKTCGPPECYAWSEFTEMHRLYIKKCVDIWSFGCVSSEVVVWVVNGYHGSDGLEDYRQQRLNDPDKIENFRGGNCFHNGKDVRESVQMMHDRIRGNFRNSDKVTGLVLDLVNMMLRGKPDSRPPASMLLYEAENAIKKGKKFFHATLPRRSPTSEPISPSGQWRPPSLEPEISPASRDKRRSNTSQTTPPPKFFPEDGHKYVQSPEPSLSDRGEVDDRIIGDSSNAIEDIIPPLGRFHVSSSGDTFKGFHGQDYRRSTVLEKVRPERSRTGTGVSFAPEPLHGESSGGKSAHAFRQRSLHEQNFREQEEHNGALPSIPRQQSVREQGAHWSKHAEKGAPGRSSYHSLGYDMAADEKLAWQIQEELDADARSESQHTASSAQHSHASRIPHGISKVQLPENGNGSVDAKSTRVIRRESIPHLSVAAAVNWRRSRGREALDGSSYLSYLDDRDHCFLIDDSASMKPYWNELIALLDALSYMTKSRDPDGVELYFMTSIKKIRSKNSSDLVSHVRQVTPQNTVDATIRLGIILQTYVSKIQASAASTPARGSSILWKPKLSGRNKRVRGLNIYVMTTGVWQPACELDPLIKKLVEQLDQYNLPAAPIGIEFIRFGDSALGKRRLQHLDDELKLKSDIIDTESSTGNVWKMLLGSINRWFDND